MTLLKRLIAVVRYHTGTAKVLPGEQMARITLYPGPRNARRVGPTRRKAA